MTVCVGGERGCGAWVWAWLCVYVYVRVRVRVCTCIPAYPPAQTGQDKAVHRQVRHPTLQAQMHGTLHTVNLIASGLVDAPPGSHLQLRLPAIAQEQRLHKAGMLAMMSWTDTTVEDCITL